MKWTGPADDLIRQAYYRILGAISFHAPISESIKAIQYIAQTKRGGDLTYWGKTRDPFQPRPGGIIFDVWSWDGLEAYPGITMNIWVYGSEYSNNTAFLRKQWWRLYIFEAVAKSMGILKVPR